MTAEWREIKATTADGANGWSDRRNAATSVGRTGPADFSVAAEDMASPCAATRRSRAMRLNRFPAWGITAAGVPG